MINIGSNQFYIACTKSINNKDNAESVIREIPV